MKILKKLHLISDSKQSIFMLSGLNLAVSLMNYNNNFNLAGHLFLCAGIINLINLLVLKREKFLNKEDIKPQISIEIRKD